MNDIDAYYAVIDSIPSTPIPKTPTQEIEEDTSLSSEEKLFMLTGATAYSWGLTALEGTETQRFWAERLRSEFLERQEAELDEECIDALKTNPTAQKASFWIEYEKKPDDKTFDFLLGIFTKAELELAEFMTSLKPLIANTENQLEFGEVNRKKFFQNVGELDAATIERIHTNEETGHADFWIKLRRHAAKNILIFAIGERSIDEIDKKNKAKNPARRFHKRPII